MFSKQLLIWYQQYGRHDLPWQHNPTPYRVWISEIMLQQTQVSTVIPYYERFMQRFPSVQVLATAHEDDILSHWSGLGYYARARNIYKTAKIIHHHYQNQFPETVELIATLPGIGKSTAGAILSFSMQKKAVILDGNVKRVLARYFAITKPINDKQTIDELWKIATQLTPNKNTHHYNQAIMDLGATLCTRSKPRCHDCPFIKTCAAHQMGQPAIYPVKTAKKTRPVKQKQFLIIQNKQNEILLLKRPSTGIWGGLWCFPEIDIKQHCRVFQYENSEFKLQHQKTLEKITHSFTHFVLDIFPVKYKTASKIAKKRDSEKIVWYNLNKKLPGGIATPVATILKML